MWRRGLFSRWQRGCAGRPVERHRRARPRAVGATRRDRDSRCRFRRHRSVVASGARPRRDHRWADTLCHGPTSKVTPCPTRPLCPTTLSCHAGNGMPTPPRRKSRARSISFYVWYERLVEQGTVKRGQRLARERRTVSRQGVVDGPFAETKEMIGGYWIIVAASLEQAAEIAGAQPVPGARPELRDPADRAGAGQRLRGGL